MGLNSTLLNVSRPAGWLTLAIAVGVPLVALPVLPDEIPRHYDLAGNINAYGPKWLILTIPGISLFLYGLFSIFQKHVRVFATMNAHTGGSPPDTEQVRAMLQATKALTMLLFAILGTRTVAIAMEHPDLVPPWLIWVPLVLVTALPFAVHLASRR